MSPRFDLGLLDLGFSSYQLEDEERGLSYLPENDEAPLDMRFDNSSMSNFVTASDILNTGSQLELQQMFKRFADEQAFNKLSTAIVEARADIVYSTTGDFKEAIQRAFPKAGKDERNRVTKRAF